MLCFSSVLLGIVIHLDNSGGVSPLSQMNQRMVFDSLLLLMVVVVVVGVDGVLRDMGLQGLLLWILNVFVCSLSASPPRSSELWPLAVVVLAVVLLVEVWCLAPLPS